MSAQVKATGPGGKPADDRAPAQMEKPAGQYRWAICALLFFVITINYIDRQIIGVLKPVIEADMGWSEVDYGNIVTAFQASYGIGLLVVGRWLDRVGTRKGVAIAIGLWSLAACFHAAARSVLAFILARIALGVAESAAYPGAVKSVAEWFPRRERALGVGILNAGANVGVLLTPIIAIGIAGAYGWRSAFLVTGLIGFVVLWGWLRFFRQPADHAELTDSEREWINQDGEDPAGAPLGWKDALRQRQAWYFICGKFFTDPVWYLFLFWLPDFLGRTQGMELFPTGDSGILATIGPALIGVYLLADVGSIAGGWLSSHLVGRGWSINRARKTTLLIAALLAVPMVTVASAPSPMVAVMLIGLGTAAHQAFSSNIFTMISDLYPRRAVATIAGMGGAAGAVGGILIAQATGWTLELTGSYVPIVIYAGLAYLIALACIHALVPRMEPAQLPG
ncbi:MFS transporter [Alteraurantiacibacter aestuarii]|uniref:MFS transporter n=1 Tax=Alteraurantiacibacter aestuarii TaxID=650004 RepID=A0A844ZRF9_9SPHN|nr:MFS transporter [Alteraurantiacibacter aestuarii]MXO88189.1 MFS transporter [Alteraurantiacibacter aestuarii]